MLAHHHISHSGCIFRWHSVSFFLSPTRALVALRACRVVCPIIRSSKQIYLQFSVYWPIVAYTIHKHIILEQKVNKKHGPSITKYSDIETYNANVDNCEAIHDPHWTHSVNAIHSLNTLEISAYDKGWVCDGVETVGCDMDRKRERGRHIELRWNQKRQWVNIIN